MCAIGEFEEVADDVGKDIVKHSQTRVITLNNKQLKFIRVKGNYNRLRRNVRFLHINVPYPAVFCALRMSNDARYTPGEPGGRTDSELKKYLYIYTHNTLTFVDSSRVISAMADYRNHSVGQIGGTEKIPASTALFFSFVKYLCSFNE